MELPEKTLQKLKLLKEHGFNTIEDLDPEYLLTSAPDWSYAKIEADFNILELLKNNLCSFQQLVDRFKKIPDSSNDPSLYKLLSNEDLFRKKLINNNVLTTKDLKYLFDEIKAKNELEAIVENQTLLNHIIDNTIISVQDLIDKFASVTDNNTKSCLDMLLLNRNLFIHIMKNKLLTTDDLRHLLNKIATFDEFDYICRNASLIYKILNEFILDTEIVEKLNEILRKKRKKGNKYTVFDHIEGGTNNYDILTLNTVNKFLYVFDLNKEQKLELSEILKYSEKTQNRLKYIIENQLESNYDFESLMNYLKKPEKKLSINI